MNVLMIAAPVPAVNPVMNLKEFLLVLRPKNCVDPSITKGKMMIRAGINIKV